MSRSQAGGMTRQAVEASHASSAAKAREQRRAPSASELVMPASLSNQAVGHALGGGTPLEGCVRAEMESRFGADFSTVRIHDEASAHGMAQQRWAQAFTVGNHIAFNRGRYAPSRRDGKHLLAHELAHVVQQRRGGTELPHAGGRLEQAAEQAAFAVAAGSSPVQVAGSSAVAVARQPLPEEEAVDLPPPPKSLSGSLAKDEKNLKEPALKYEMTLIEDYLDALPTTPQREHLLAEYKALFQERVARRENATAWWPKPEELTEEVQEAHRHWRLTGEIPQTSRPFSWVEIKAGRPMTRRERYDLMLKLQGIDHPLIGDVYRDESHPGEGVRDPEFLTHEEFDKEFHAQYEREVEDCIGNDPRPGTKYKCGEAANEKYGGPGYREYREEQYRRTYALWVHAQEQIESMKSSGVASLAGRAAGYGLGALTGHDALRLSEHGAALGSIVGLAGSGYVGYQQWSQMRSYKVSGGHEVRPDADIHLIQPRSYGAAPTPTRPVTPQFTRGGSSKPAAQPPFSSTSSGSLSSPFGGTSTQTGSLSTPIPISSGKGLPQSAASKALQSNLAKQSPAKAGSVTPLPVRKPDISPKTQPAQQKMPEVAAVEDKIAVGQTHGAGGTVATSVTPTTSVGAGAQSAVASVKPPSKSSKTTGTGSVKPSVASTPKSTGSTSSVKMKAAPPVTVPVKSPVKTGAKKTPVAPVPVNASGGRGTNAEKLVAVRVQGGGSAGKGTYVVEGTPEFEKAANDNRFVKMPESDAIAHKFRPVGTAFDQTIEPLKIGGVQVESNGAGTGKGSKHNISARADIHSTQKANAATFGKSIGATLAEAHGQKTLIDGNEVVVLRPGNASTGGVDSITADVGRTAKPATRPGAVAATAKTTPKVFLNDFTGPKTSKAAKPTHANWVNELRDAVVDKRFGFNNKTYDNAVYDAIEKGEVYVREVRIEKTPQGTKVTLLKPRKVSVPASVKAEAAKARKSRP